MQDRFKFRVWNKKVKKMYDVKSMSYIDGVIKRIEVQGDIGIAIFDEYGKHIDNCILMQCTDLKDKNDKLIYEGDIVTYDDRDICPHHTPILNAIIEMRKYQWCMIYYRKDIINASTRKPVEQKTWLGFDDFITSRIEVIGNIYENKELLESE